MKSLHFLAELPRDERGKRKMGPSEKEKPSQKTEQCKDQGRGEHRRWVS